MWIRLFLATAIVASLPWEIARADLTIGMFNVGWEGTNAHNIDTGPYLFRNVDETSLVSVRAKITSQSTGNWSQAGIMLRNPASASVDGFGTNEDWVLNISFRPSAATATHKTVNGINGIDTDSDTTGLTAAALNYLRIDRVGSGQFQLYRGTGTDDNITWTQHSVGVQSNPDLAGATLEVGVTGGDYIGGLAGSTTVFDWVDIQTIEGPAFDDFSYNHNFFTGGVPGFDPGAETGGGIWNGIYNANLGGRDTTAAFQGCTVCTWNTNAGDWNRVTNWAGGITEAPTGNNLTAIFGSSLVQPVATVFTDEGVRVKELRFDNLNRYVLAGAAQVTLEADTGNAQINVLQGTHEIQVPLSLADDVTASVNAGATLNVNAPVHLNGHDFNTSGGGTVNLNQGTIGAGSGQGGGSAVNGGDLVGLAGVDGDFTQTADGSLGVVVGDAPIHVSGAAVLDGSLDVSLAEGFTPAAGRTYAVLTAESVTDSGLRLSGDAAGLFRLSVTGDSIALIAVPEPTAAAIAICVGCAFATLRRRRNDALLLH
jgi:hypothetical protein